MLDKRAQRQSSLARAVSRNGNAPTDGAAPAWQLLSSRAQRVIATMVFAAVGIALACWLLSSGPWGGVINIDAAEPLQTTFQVDLNNADWPELSQLPEIGETLAKRIIESREQEGPFRSIDDLSRVRGIGPKTLDKVKPYLGKIK